MSSNLPPDEDLQPLVDRVTEGIDPAAEAVSIEQVAAAATAGLLREHGLTPLPPGLTQRLQADMKDFVQPDRKVVRPGFGGSVVSWTGWLVAAACVALLLTSGPTHPRPERSLAGAELVQRLEADPDVLRVAFAPGEDGEGGEVLWSNRRQQGVLTLRGIRPNNPSREQYQLWIVDPKRDARFPVDGGVFDVSSADGTVTIPVDAKLRILEPTAFVITREQPGGVVKSQAEKPVLVASVR